MKCEQGYVTGDRRGQACPHPARYVVVTPFEKLVVCGYHRRAYTASYLLDRAERDRAIWR